MMTLRRRTIVALVLSATAVSILQLHTSCSAPFVYSVAFGWYGGPCRRGWPVAYVTWNRAYNSQTGQLAESSFVVKPLYILLDVVAFIILLISVAYLCQSASRRFSLRLLFVVMTATAATIAAASNLSADTFDVGIMATLLACVVVAMATATRLFVRVSVT